MRHSVGLLRLFASATLVLIAAEPTHTVAQTECEAKRRSCIAECRAQYFTIDPKRNACIANCVAEANKCIRDQAVRQGTPAMVVSDTLVPGALDLALLERLVAEARTAAAR